MGRSFEERVIAAIAELKTKVDSLGEQIKLLNKHLEKRAQANGIQDINIARLDERVANLEEEQKTRFRKELAIISGVVALVTAFIQILPALLGG